MDKHRICPCLDLGGTLPVHWGATPGRTGSSTGASGCRTGSCRPLMCLERSSPQRMPHGSPSRQGHRHRPVDYLCGRRKGRVSIYHHSHSHHFVVSLYNLSPEYYRLGDDSGAGVWRRRLQCSVRVPVVSTTGSMLCDELEGSLSFKCHSPSRLAWSGFFTRGQLSVVSGTPSQSL